MIRQKLIPGQRVKAFLLGMDRIGRIDLNGNFTDGDRINMPYDPLRIERIPETREETVSVLTEYGFAQDCDMPEKPYWSWSCADGFVIEVYADTSEVCGWWEHAPFRFPCESFELAADLALQMVDSCECK